MPMVSPETKWYSTLHWLKSTVIDYSTPTTWIECRNMSPKRQSHNVPMLLPTNARCHSSSQTMFVRVILYWSLLQARTVRVHFVTNCGVARAQGVADVSFR